MWNILPTLSNTIKNQTLLSCVSIVLKPKIESRQEGLLLTITLLGLPWQLTWERIRLQCRRPRFNSWVRKIGWRRGRLPTLVFLGFPCSSAGKESTCNREDLSSISGLGWSPREGKGYPLQYSGLQNSMACIVNGVAKRRTADTTEWLSLSHSLRCYHWKQFCCLTELSDLLQRSNVLRIPWGFYMVNVGDVLLIHSWYSFHLEQPSL